MEVMLAILASVFLLASADANVLTNPGFESGTTGWSAFWARSLDSGSSALSSAVFHAGTRSLEVHHRGSRDWSVARSATTPATVGEVWSWSAWVRVDSLLVDAFLGFVTRDSSGNVQDWNAGATHVPVSDTGWVHVDARLGVPRGAATLQPRLIGDGVAHLWFDDGDFHRESTAPKGLDSVVLRDDSLRVVLDPVDLSILLVDSLSGTPRRLAGLPGFHFDSARASGDSALISIHSVAAGWPATLKLTLRGGALELAMAADSASPMDGDLEFPGSIATEPGQRLAMPRGTGLGVPVEYQGEGEWALRYAYLWEWQVSLALTGATDGVTGFVVSVDQPWDARLAFEHGADPTLLQPRIFQAPSKGVWGHDRSALVAPLRTGGWAEMALRHRRRLEQLGRVRDWNAKIAANPDVDRLRGASDFWVEGSGWSKIQWTFFDSLRQMGAEKAVIHWGPVARQIDSLNAHGWLSSVYECYADAYPPGTPGFQSLEYPDGAIVQEDGTPLDGWLAHPASGDLQALEVCSARHPSMARSLISAERTTTRRNARFIDVELAIGLQECWSSIHPVDRARDAANRVLTLSTVKDSFQLVTGSEQTRDFATGHVDWGEGPMSIATVADAGYDWNTPEAPEARMDSLSMSPSYRVPLLPLALHDVVAPTWYTGDGQSKVPERWNAKDAWNALYATMPLIQPDGRAMWDSLAARYLRSMVLLGSLHERAGFAPMTEFVTLSQDRALQRTRFANGWSVVANFAAQTRDAEGASLPPDGFVAQRFGERVERSLSRGAILDRLLLSDRLYLDPEGALARRDGVRTTGPVFVRRESDTTLLLAFVGDQAWVDLDPAALPWPSGALRASVRGSGASVALATVDSGMVRLARVGSERFYRLHGAFGAFSGAAHRSAARSRLEIHPSGTRLSCQWTQSVADRVRLEMFSGNGARLWSRTVPGRAGWNRLEIPAPPAPSWLRLSNSTESVTAAVPRAR